MEYTWNVLTCWRDSTDMIFKMEYKVTGKKNDLKVSTMDQLRFKKSENPINYKDLKEDQLVAWVKAKLGTDRENKIYTFLTKEMERKEKRFINSGVPF
tara:strand:- start:1154 stop:1447 length:294 start_codon:yes stop_codon:yes gene_type:complete